MNISFASIFLTFLFLSCISGSPDNLSYSTDSNSVHSVDLLQGEDIENGAMTFADLYQNESFFSGSASENFYLHHNSIILNEIIVENESFYTAEGFEMISNFDVELSESNNLTMTLQQEDQNSLGSRFRKIFYMILSVILSRLCGLVITAGVCFFTCFIPIIFLIVFLSLRD